MSEQEEKEILERLEKSPLKAFQEKLQDVIEKIKEDLNSTVDLNKKEFEYLKNVN